VEPAGGLTTLARLQRQAARLEYSRAETNFTLAFVELKQRLRRRSLVIVITDFVDTTTAELMVETLERLSKGHLVLFVSLRDTGIEELARAEPRGLDGLNRAMTAHDLVRERETVIGRLRRQGVHCIDCPPSTVSSRLINRYLDIKRRELL
jgi:uncharacterized protein (DUF58 family)